MVVNKAFNDSLYNDEFFMRIGHSVAKRSVSSNFEQCHSVCVGIFPDADGSGITWNQINLFVTEVGNHYMDGKSCLNDLNDILHITHLQIIKDKRLSHECLKALQPAQCHMKPENMLLKKVESCICYASCLNNAG